MLLCERGYEVYYILWMVYYFGIFQDFSKEFMLRDFRNDALWFSECMVYCDGVESRNTSNF